MEKKSKLKFIYYESRLDFLKQEESFSKEGYVKDLYKKLPQLNEDNKLTVKNLVSFWKAIIIKSCRILKTLEGNLTDVETSSRFTISVQHLFETFTFHGYRPSCLEQVLDIMKQEGSLESLDMYNSDAFNGFLNWFFKSLKGLFWSYDKNLEKLVVLPAVEVSNYIYLNIFMSLSNKIESETFYDEVLKKSHDFVDCLFSMDDLLKKRHELSSCIFTDGDLKIVLRFLQRRGRVLVDSKNDVIKFVKKKSSISSNDYQILQVKNTLEKVRSLYHKFSAQIDEAREAAKDSGKSNKSRTLLYLKRKKDYEKKVDQLSKQMLILERILEEIRTLDASKSVTEAIQSGVETLKSLLPFKVEVLGTMDSLKDVLKEVENLSQIVQSDDDYAGLEEEFMAIVSELETGKQEKPDKLEEEELKRCLDELLSVPATPPPEEETSFEKSVLDQ